MSTLTEAPTYLAGKTAPPEQIQEWVEQFHRDGYLFIPSVLAPDHVAELKADLDRTLPERGKSGGGITT